MMCPVMFLTLASNVMASLSVKKHYSVENVVKNSKIYLNPFPKTVSLKTRFLFMFTYFCEILIVLTIISVTVKITQPVMTIFYVKAAIETR